MEQPLTAVHFRATRPLQLWAACCLLLAVLAGVLAGCQDGSPASAGPRPSPYVSPTPRPTKTTSQLVEEALSFARGNPSSLVSRHLAQGAKCESCHNPFPPKYPPAEAPCLACHGETPAKVEALKKSSVTQWHAMHVGVIPCSDCHYIHEKFEPKCLVCHPACTFCTMNY